MAWEAEPEDEHAIVWYGRRTAYTGDYAAAVDIYTRGLEFHPDSARLLRHRGHRWISLREFDRAVADLQRAAELTANAPDVVEADGMPNERGIPTSSLHTNVWYHLALAHYCRGEFADAQRCWEACLSASRNPDMECAARYWLFHAATRAGDARAAAAALAPVRPGWILIENHAYHELLLLYGGTGDPPALAHEHAEAVDSATRGYGLARWYAMQGDVLKERTLLIALAAVESAAFGCIAAEADLARYAAPSAALPTDPR